MIDLVILSVVVMVLSYIIIGKYIDYANLHFAQPFLEDGPKHEKKKGTPTMGGVSIFGIYIILCTVFLLAYNMWRITTYKVSGFSHYYLFVILVAVVGYFIIGFIDDYKKVKFKKNTKGLSPFQKLIFQLLISIVIIFLLHKGNYSTHITFYLFNVSINFGLLYYIFIPILFLAMTNATNLTDGIDGLLVSNIIISIIFLTIIAVWKNNVLIIYSNVLLLSILVPFYIYNKNPAKIFMGDVGSLTLGSYLTIVAILLKVEILLLSFAMIYFLETLSVIFQVGYFKYTKKKTGEGKRLLLMAPLHHHLEKKGNTEKQIVFKFCIINIIFSILGLIIYIY